MADKFNLERFKEQYENSLKAYCDGKAFETHLRLVGQGWEGMENTSTEQEYKDVDDFLNAKHQAIRTALYKQFGIEHLL